MYSDMLLMFWGGCSWLNNSYSYPKKAKMCFQQLNHSL